MAEAPTPPQGAALFNSVASALVSGGSTRGGIDPESLWALMEVFAIVAELKGIDLSDATMKAEFEKLGGHKDFLKLYEKLHAIVHGEALVSPRQDKP